MKYSTGNDIIFIVLIMISALALLSMHGVVSAVFFVLSLSYIIFEHKIADYWRSA